MTLFKKNLELLKEKDERASELFREDEPLDDGFEILKSKSGEWTLKVMKEGRRFFLHSLYDPVEEARRVVEGFKLERKEVIFCFGFGLGYYLKEILKRAGENAKLFVLEPSKSVFRAALHVVDLSPILSDRRVELLVALSAKELAERLNDEEILNRELEVIPHHSSIELSRGFFKFAKLLLSFTPIHKKRSNRITLMESDKIQLLLEGLLYRNWSLGLSFRFILSRPKRNYKNILLIQLSSIGDVVYTTPVFPGLKEKYSNSRISFLTEEAAELLSDDPHINEVIVFEKEHFIESLLMEDENPILKISNKMKLFVEELRKRKFDAVINLHTSPRSAVLTNLIKAGDTFGLSIDRYGNPIIIGNPWMHYKYWVSTTCRAGEEGALKPVEEHILMTGVNPIHRRTKIFVNGKVREKALKKLKGYAKEEGLVGFATGANFPTRRWRERSFAKLGDLLMQRENTKVVIFGGRDDVERVSKIVAMMKRKPINLSGKTTLQELASMLPLCRLFISNDSGPVHIAAAVGVPTITIAGPAWVGPYGARHVALQARIPCRGCSKVECNHLTCMEKITPEAVLVAIEILEELRREEINYSKITDLLCSPSLREVDILYSGLEKPDRLYTFHPLTPKVGAPSEIVKAFIKYSSLNIWAMMDGKRILFGVDEVKKAVRKSLKLNGKVEEVIRLLNETRKDFLHLKKLTELAAEAIRTKNSNLKTYLRQIDSAMREVPSSKSLEYFDAIDYGSGLEGLLTRYLDKNYVCNGMANFIAELINSYQGERGACNPSD